MEKFEQQKTVLKAGASTWKKTILVVDDNADLLDLSKTMLELDDYEVFTALGAKEAFAILREANNFDLILLDLKMGKTSGPRFLEELEQEIPEIIERVPVVFLTAMDRIPDSKAVGFIRKPFEMNKFLAAVQGFIENGSAHLRLN